jgi:hypothetical protein
MGGYGSGRRWGTKSTTGAYLQLDVRRLQRDGLLERRGEFNWRWSRNGEAVGDINIRPETDRVILRYRTRSRGETDWVEQQFPVSLGRTPCHYGGERVWFHCPARGCGRRVAILYGGAIFACRHCHLLAYPCQREQPHDRALNRVQDLNIKLGGTGCTFDGMPPRPKGMHRVTYQRIAARYDWLEKVMDLETIARFGWSL